jgi:hypothetical protein
MTEMHCYQDWYKDTLITHFFKKLEIYDDNNTEIPIDPFNRKNWKETLEFKDGNCGGGNINYKLFVNKQ